MSASNPFQKTVVCLIASFLLLQTAWGQPVPDRETLLLVNFEGSANTFDADFSRGSSFAQSTAAATEGRFGRGVRLGRNATVAFVGNDGNFEAAKGTIEFWIKPDWPGDDSNKHSIFSCRFGARGYININMVGNGRIGIAISSGEGDEWTWRRAEADTREWKPDEWHHVACSWGDGQIRIFADGSEGSRSVTDARMPDAMPETLLLSAAEAVMDAFRISRRMFTADDVQRSIQSAMGPPPFEYVGDLVRKNPDNQTLPRRTRLGNIQVPIALGTSCYFRGFVCQPGEAACLTLDGTFATFQAHAGVEAFSAPNDKCSFEVWGDGRKLFETDAVGVADGAQQISVSVAGVRSLRLISRPVSPVHGTTLAVWANAALGREDAQIVVPTARPMKPAEIDMYRRQVSADDYHFEPARSGSYFVATKFWEDDVDPAQAPAEDRIGVPLSASAVPGEYEPLNFVVYAADGLKQVEVAASDLKSADASISASRIDIRPVLRGLMRDIYTLPPERSTVVSRFLLPNRPVDIPNKTMREYHLIVHVPEKAPAGTYRGSVSIRPKNEPPQQLPVELDVLPFLWRPLTRKEYGIYYRFPADSDKGTQTKLELTDIRVHGATTLKAPIGVEYSLEDGNVQVSFEELRVRLNVLRSLGFRGPFPVSTGCEHAARLLEYNPVAEHTDATARDRFRQVIRRAMTGLAELSREYPEFEFLPTHMDEVFGRDRLDRYIRFTEAVRQVPSLRVFITLHNDPRRDAHEMMKVCDPFVDIRCYNGHVMDEWIRAGHSFEELQKQLADSGDEAWTYYNIRGSFFKAEWTRLVNGFYLWISPLRGHLPWMYYSYSGNPLDDLDGPHLRGHDFAYAVPDPEAPARLISTRHWEAYREGVDDMRYLCTLEDLIAENRDAPAAQAAQKWLDQLRAKLRPDPKQLEAIEGESPILRLWSDTFDGADYRRFRHEAAEHIAKLTANQ